MGRNNSRHVAVGIEAVVESVNLVQFGNTIDIHVRDPADLNEVLSRLREEFEPTYRAKTWPHPDNNRVAVRLD